MKKENIKLLDFVEECNRLSDYRKKLVKSLYDIESLKKKWKNPFDYSEYHSTADSFQIRVNKENLFSIPIEALDEIIDLISSCLNERLDKLDKEINSYHISKEDE